MRILRLALISSLAVTVACSAESLDLETSEPVASDDDALSDDGAGPVGANFEVLLTDAPGDFDEVWVEIRAVEIDAGDRGWLTVTDEAQSFDLLTLQNDVTAALGGAALEAGHYGQLRLLVDSAFVVVDGVSEDLRIASGPQTGIKINLDANVEDGMTYTLVIDFDAHKSVKQTGQGWLMTPVITVKDFAGVPTADDDAGDESGESDDDGGEPVE